jgi:hypothetical protein
VIDASRESPKAPIEIQMSAARKLPSTRQLVLAIIGTLWGGLGLVYWALDYLLSVSDRTTRSTTGGYAIGQWFGRAFLFLLFAVGSITLADYYSRHRQNSRRARFVGTVDEDTSVASAVDSTNERVEFFPARIGCYVLLILFSIAMVGLFVVVMFGAIFGR